MYDEPKRGRSRGGLPVAEGVFEGFGDGADADAGGEKFRDVEDAVGTGGFCAGFVKLRVAFPERERTRGAENALDLLDDVARGDEAGVRDVVGAEGRAALPEIEGGAREIRACTTT